MVAAGTAMILLAMYGGWLMIRKKVENAGKWFFKALLFSISLPFIANTAGWIMTEIGRQPWTVFGLITTEDSISPNVSAGSMLFSLIAFSVIYAVLAGVMAYLFVKVIKKGPYAAEEDHHAADPFDKEGFGRVS